MSAPLLSHLQRRSIIDAPLPVCRVHTHSYRWGGMLIRDTVPEAGGRVWKVSQEDEEYFHNHVRVGDK